MKAFLPLLLVLTLGFNNTMNGQCQMINGGFESWVDMTDSLEYELGLEFEHAVILPEGWFSIFRLIEIAFSDVIIDYFDEDSIDIDLFSSIEQYEPGALGTDYALKMNGDSLVLLSDLFQIFPCEGRPDKFRGQFKHVGEGNDSLQIFVLFHNSDVLDSSAAIGYGTFLSVGGPDEYTPIEVDIEYNSEEIVDSATIVILTSRDPNVSDGESFFVLDEFTFEGGNVPVTDYATYRPNLFSPNPASSQIVLSGDLTDVERIEMYDLVGQRVLDISGSGSDGSVNVSHLSHGIYVAKVRSGDQTFVQKIVVNN